MAEAQVPHLGLDAVRLEVRHEAGDRPIYPGGAHFGKLRDVGYTDAVAACFLVADRGRMRRCVDHDQYAICGRTSRDHRAGDLRVLIVESGFTRGALA